MEGRDPLKGPLSSIPKSGSGGSEQMQMRGLHHSVTQVLSDTATSVPTSAQGLCGLRSTGLKEGEGPTFSHSTKAQSPVLALTSQSQLR